MARFFPNLKPEAASAVRTVQRLMLEDDGYLDDPLCPYDADTKSWLRALLPSGNGASREDAPIEDLETEAKNLYRFLKSLKPAVGGNDGDGKDALNYARVATALLEKLLSLAERAEKVQEVKQFQETVMSFMEDILAPEQRTIFIDRLTADGLR